MSRIYIDYLRDMLENANRAIEFTEGMNFEVIWQTLNEDLPMLADTLQEIIRREEK